MQLQVAYLINQYPQVSHSFIRREILALERQGAQVMRISLRGWDAELVDPADLRERERTRYVLAGGAARLLAAALRTFARSPRRFLSALALALRTGAASDRSVLVHLAYLAEACVVAEWLHESGAGHLHAHFATNSTDVAMLARVLGGPPYSFTVHGTAEFDRFRFLGLKEKVARAAFVAAVCSYGRSQLYRFLGHESWPKVQVVRCGLEPSFSSGDPVAPAARSRLICVGRLSEEKGQLLLLAAAARLAEEGAAFELVFAGDGPLRPEMEILIARYGLSGRVRITGWISSDQVRREISEAGALVLPSFSEGLPVVIMEAMALRRPVLTTFVGGIPELVQAGETGWLVPAGSVEALAGAMRAFLVTPDDQLRRMGDAGHRRVDEHHRVDVEATKLAALFARSVTH